MSQLQWKEAIGVLENICGDHVCPLEMIEDSGTGCPGNGFPNLGENTGGFSKWEKLAGNICTPDRWTPLPSKPGSE
jgi:hypothetical protein